MTGAENKLHNYCHLTKERKNLQDALRFSSAFFPRSCFSRGKHTMRGTGGEPVRGVAVLTLTGVLSQVVGFVYRILLTRLAGAEILGCIN